MTLLPDSIMGNRDLMQALAEFSEPLVRITDMLVSGEAGYFVVCSPLCECTFLCSLTVR